MSLRTCWIWRTSMWSSHLHLDILWGFSGDSDGKESTCNAEAWVWSLSWEDLLEEGIATHFSILAWRIPMDRGTWWATVHGTAKSQTWLSDHRISKCRCELDSYIHLSFSFQIIKCSSWDAGWHGWEVAAGPTCSKSKKEGGRREFPERVGWGHIP